MYELSIKKMREAAGFKKQPDAARALGWKERRYASIERGEVKDAHCLDGNGVPALSGDELGAKGDRATRDLVEDLRDDGIVLVRVRADTIASHGYLQEREWCS